MDPLVAAYLHHLDVERNCSPHTLRNYGGHWTACLRFLARTRPDRTATTATTADLRAFLADLKTHTCPETRARVLTALRMGYTFAVREGLRPDNPALPLLFPKVAKRVPIVPPREAVAQLLDAPWPDSWLGRRNHAIAELMYGTGLRISEACGLPRDALDLAHRRVRVMGKGRKEATLPIPTAAVRALGAYLADPTRPAVGSAACFVGQKGERFGVTGVRRMLARRATSLGVPYIKPHGLRKAFATALAENGADVREVQALLRHDDISTTMIYFDVVETARLAAVVDRAHPRAV